MTFKSIATASIALAMLASPALAQNSGTGAGNGSGSGTSIQAQTYASDAEKMMYDENRAAWSGFFTDESMSTLKTDDEVRAAFNAMDGASQAGMKSSCEKAAEDRGSYGTVTNSLCDSVMKM